MKELGPKKIVTGTTSKLAELRMGHSRCGKTASARLPLVRKQRMRYPSMSSATEPGMKRMKKTRIGEYSKSCVHHQGTPSEEHHRDMSGQHPISLGAYQLIALQMIAVVVGRDRKHPAKQVADR